MATTPTTVIDSRPTPVDLYLYAGDDVDLNVAVTDTAGTPVDLTGFTASAQIRATADANTSVDFEATLLANAVALHLDGTETTGLPAKAVWDVQITSATGAVTTLAAGKVNVYPEVTR